uniref:Bardet-Biedl syndrome 12 n=1 Tax=Acanthochromis polyacanthus TaxID=80966 RepID=A0A3Q1F5N1_9TELE
MLESTILNHRQHVGLQKLSALAGVSHSCLGPNKKYKFIQDDVCGESALACSCFRIIESLELTCAVGQLVHETIQAHQNVYHTGSGCLLFLAGAWSRAALDCLQRGISVAHIISAMSEGMDVCMDVCRKCTISTEGLAVKRDTATSSGLQLQLAEKLTTNASRVSNVNHKTLNISEQRKIKLSRHFCETKPQPQLPDITHIAEGLSHGCDDTMTLVVEAFQRLLKTNQQDTSQFMFDISKVVTCVLPGLPEQHACVVPGCVVLLSAEQTLVAHHLNEQHLKVVLINGDLSDTYRHLGFKRLKGVQRVSDQLSASSREDEWLAKVVGLLLNLEVKLILVSGLASEKVIQRCCTHHVLVVEKVKVSVLKTFADSTGAIPVTYATQLSKHCVGSGAGVKIWRDLGSHDSKSATAVNVSAGMSSELVTVVLTSCVHGKLQALEDQFWACAYRLHHALKDRALLPGAGRTEMLCIHHLKQLVECSRETNHSQQTTRGTAANHYRGVVLHLMAEGLIDYISTVMVNTGRFSKVKARMVLSRQLQNCNKHLGISENFSQLFLEDDGEDSAVFSEMKPVEALEIYDNLSVKQEAWRKALDLVFLVLQTDAEVITGVGQKTDAALENVTLL